jgi:hypothetical protein
LPKRDIDKVGRIRLIPRSSYSSCNGDVLLAAIAPYERHCAARARRTYQSRGFQDLVERLLVPELRAGDVVIMNNLSSHKGDAYER